MRKTAAFIKYCLNNSQKTLYFAGGLCRAVNSGMGKLRGVTTAAQ